MAALPSIPPTSNNINFLLAQYQECSEDHRHYSTLIWEVPSVAIAICGAILAVDFSIKINEFARPFFLFIGFAFDIVMIIAVGRYRMFELARRRDIEAIEDMLRPVVPSIVIRKSGKPILQNATYYGVSNHWLNRRMAFRWLYAMMCVLAIAILSVTIHSISLILRDSALIPANLTF